MAMDQLEISDLIVEEANRQGVNADTLQKIIFQGENSSYKGAIPTDLVSPKQAKGIGQVIPSTWAGLQKQGKIPEDADPNDPRMNIRASSFVLQDAEKRYPDNPRAQYAYYNGGHRQGDPVAAGGEPPAEETKKYLDRTIPDGRKGMSDQRIPPNMPPLGSFNPRDMSEVDDPRFRLTNTSTTKRTNALNTSAVLEDFAKYNKSVDEISRMLASTTDAYKAAETQNQSAIKQTLEAGLATNEAAGAEAARRQESKNIDEGILGLSNTDPNSRYIELQRQRMEAIKVKDSLRDRINTEDAVQIYEDPLRWVVNQFTLPSLKMTYNAAVNKEHAASDEMARTNQLALTRQTLDLGHPLDEINKTLAAKNMATTAAAATASAESTLKGAQLAASSYMQQLAAAQGQQSAKVAEMNMIIRATEQSLTEKSNLAMQPAVDAENFRRLAIGSPTINEAMLNGMSKEDKADLAKRAALPKEQYAASPGKTFLWLHSVGADLTQPQNRALAETYDRQLWSPAFNKELANQRDTDPTFMHKTYEQQIAFVLDKIALQESHKLRAEGSYDKLEPTSPYKLILGNAIFLPELKNNMFTAEIQAVLDKKRVGDSLTPAEIEGIATAKMLSGTPIAEITRDMSALYRTLAKEQWAQSGAAKAGWERPGAWKTTTAQVNGKQIDQYKEADIEHWLMQQAVRRVGSSDLLQLKALGFKPTRTP